jgi:formylglycine-generating enzyme required for sulfatase activity
VFTGASSSGTTVTVSSTANLRVGMPVYKTAGTGTFAANTVISSISSATTFVVSGSAPNLSNATITCQRIWEHASLDATAGNHTAPATSTISVPSDSTGVFIYRSANGTGTFSLSDVQLRWVYGTNGVPDDAVLQVKVFAIEMVWVPQGSFAAGSGGAETSAFTLTTINTATATTVPSGSGGFSGSAEGGYPTGQTAPANASWPNGYDAFYCMKYEISQGQYRDFLNTLTRSQQSNRVRMDGTLGRYAGGFTWNGSDWSGSEVSNLSTPANRNGLRLIADPGGILPRTYACDLISSATLPTDVDQSNDGEWIAMSQLNWMDGCAYVDWAGLRPMTELEFEKACRGDQAPLANE